ncbi:MAG: L,D-transpeptidase family protein [Bacteroidia bacterium]|nr:L,D-transpeptidase family protein [Bacteroidia bacterium]
MRVRNRWRLLIGFIAGLAALAWWQRSTRPLSRNMETVTSIRTRYEADVWQRLAPDLRQAGFDTFPDRLAILACKIPRRLTVYGYRDGWHQIKTYPFTAMSGLPGPKLREGDRQIPEGIYQVGYLNPNSSYHLSLQVNYPNAFDRERAAAEGRTQLGGDIFIHGKDVTIGCIPLGDPAIEEVFILAAAAYPQGIPVIIAPDDFRQQPWTPPADASEWDIRLYTGIQTALQAFP